MKGIFSLNGTTFVYVLSSDWLIHNILKNTSQVILYLVWYAIFSPFKRTALCIASDQVRMRVHVQDIAQQLM
jgi:hypothetical protein